MITWGFVAAYSDIVTLDEPITTTVNGNILIPQVMFINVTTTAGDIVWINGLGIPQFLPGAVVGFSYPIGATKIVTSAVVNGVTRTTTAAGFAWLGSPSAV